MEPIRFDGPSIDRTVLRRLKRLSPQLRVTWAPVSIDPRTGAVIQMSGRLDPHYGTRLIGTVVDPHFDLWNKDRYSSHHHYIRSYGPRFGHKEVYDLERDIARQVDAKDMARVLADHEQKSRARDVAHARDYGYQRLKANHKRSMDYLDGKTGHRGAKDFSFAGQTKHTSGGESNLILPDRHEDGWE
jgi:hypothetical protein